MSKYSTIDGGVTAARGFRAAGIHAGLKASKRDMALIAADGVCAAAGVFTTNRVQAAPVRLCRDQLSATHEAAAVVINSGCANACTGEPGKQNAKRMAAYTAELLGVDAGHVLVCSTGTIGTQLPMERIEAGISQAAGVLSETGAHDAACAIMTTDTRPKECAVALDVDGVTIRIGGMAKGAGMIDPRLATMLAFITTDADVDGLALESCLRSAVQRSFNRVTVDGDQSTNDTVLTLASGQAGDVKLDASHPAWPDFCAAFQYVCLELAQAMVRDGEGATKFVSVTVKGAVSGDDALLAARAIANSLLVKTSWFGCDPNWGRVIDALGYSGAEMREECVDILYDDIQVVAHGMAASDVAGAALKKVLEQDVFTVEVNLNIGDAADTVYTCDCSYDYVRINADYTT